MANFGGISLILQLLTVVPCVTALKCSRCSNAHSLDDCNRHSDECRDDEVCYLSHHTSYNGDEHYTGGCGHYYSHCGGRHSRWLLDRNRHTECCDTDMCNTKLSLNKETTETTSPGPTAFRLSGGDKATTKTTSPGPTAFRLSGGVECQVCSGATCGVTENDPLLQCPDDFPYCMNVVQSVSTGDKLVTKRCATFSECRRSWLDDTSQRPECFNMDPAEVYRKTFECTYCCETSGCNKHIVPSNETLLIGTM